MKNIYIFLLLLFVGAQNLFGQNSHKKYAYISVHFGRYGVLSSSFPHYYGSRFGKYYGGSLGIPLTEKISLFGKASYFQKEGIPIYEITNMRECSAILKEGIVNAGIQIKSYSSEVIDIFFSSGLTVAIIDEERFSPTGQFTYEIEGNGNFGIFLGGILEIKLGQSPFSLVNEINYIYSWKPLLEYENTYQALNYSVGLRFYFGGK